VVIAILTKADHDNQKLLEAAAALNLSRSDYEAHLQKLRQVCRTQGIDYILDMYDADVIIGPTDSHLASLASGSGTLT
jgi:amidase